MHAAGLTVWRFRLVIACYLLTTLLVTVGACWGIMCLAEKPVADVPRAFHEVSNRWDSLWYLAIAREGYKYEGLEVGESVAFFPLYPLLVKTASLVTGLPLEVSGLIIVHTAFLLSLIIFFRYLQERFPDEVVLQRYALLSLVVFPAGFFFRFLYSESLFLLLAILSMYLIHRGRSPLWIALVIGLATASRPVGVVLLLPFAIHLWQRETSFARAARSTAMYLPICCWGLIAYAIFQHAQFGDPLVFAKTQHHWRLRPAVDLSQMAMSFAAGEPLWSVYVPDSYAYWKRLEPHTIPCLSLAFWNPIVLVSSAAFIAIGYRRTWLSLEETLLASGLLLVPYLTRGFDFCMVSQARFSSVAFPMYITLAHLLRRAPALVTWTVLAVAALFLLYFSARFSAGFPLT